MDVEKQLGFLKQQCENIDSEILILLRRRFQTEKRMIEAKWKNNVEELFDKNRDADVLDYVLKKSREMDLKDSFMYKLYQEILDYSKEVQQDFLDEKKDK